MKIGMLLMTGNDADIIEQSIIHNMNYVNHIMVVDNDSKDETVDLVLRLKRIYDGRITLSKVKYEFQNQAIIVNVFLQGYKSNFDYTLVMDADEFIKAEDLSELKSIPMDAVGIAKWQTYCPSKTEHKIFPREITYRRYREPDGCHKVVVPRDLDVNLSLGSHWAHKGSGERIETYELKTVRLAHYPVRSLKQMERKTRLMREGFKDFDKTQSWHIREMKAPKTLFEMREEALHYASHDRDEYELVYDPLYGEK